eukprot:scaffold96076_cov63-Phaeocystis_antarctica.AAC.2
MPQCCSSSASAVASRFAAGTTPASIIRDPTSSCSHNAAAHAAASRRTPACSLSMSATSGGVPPFSATALAYAAKRAR